MVELIQISKMLLHIGLALFFFCSSFFTASGLNQQKYKVLEMETNGTLYLYRSSLLCVHDIIKRLTEGAYQMAESSMLVENCQDLKLKVPSVVSGVYWIDPGGGSHGNAFQAYCDQQTEGGGWTLVWSYTFTAYSSFTRSTNAVTPRPSWTASHANTRVSTTVPLSETHYEAMNFALWRTIGKEFLIKSNINNWIACKDGTGSLVQQKAGSITCKLVKQVSKQCAGMVPNTLNLSSRGPSISRGSHYYYFDGDTRDNWPTHDPCGGNGKNQLKDMANPHGNIFAR